MKVLFVYSSNSDFQEISPFIKSQAESLVKAGIDIDLYPLKGKGTRGYLKNIPKLRKYIKYNSFDLLHAHYLYSAIVARLSSFKLPLICSFMGSDTYGEVDINGKRELSSIKEVILSKIIQLFLDGIIVKSQQMYQDYIWRKKRALVIPNGVDLNIISLTEKNLARMRLGLDQKKSYILFLGEKENKRKNFPLLLQASQHLKEVDFVILNPYPVLHSQIPLYLSACDVLVLTSFLEGSPNVIKEAMACNCPIVSTEVGDVRWVLGNTEGCYISDFDPKNVAENINLALAFNKRTNGRKKLLELGLDSETIAKRLLKFYDKIINKR